MADEKYNFAAARARLEEIVVQVRKKDTSLEQGLDLLEEGVRLANTCTELSDHTEWRAVIDGSEASATTAGESVVATNEVSEAPEEAADDHVELTDGNTTGE